MDMLWVYIWQQVTLRWTEQTDAAGCVPHQTGLPSGTQCTIMLTDWLLDSWMTAAVVTALWLSFGLTPDHSRVSKHTKAVPEKEGGERFCYVNWEEADWVHLCNDFFSLLLCSFGVSKNKKETTQWFYIMVKLSQKRDIHIFVNKIQEETTGS